MTFSIFKKLMLASVLLAISNLGSTNQAMAGSPSFPCAKAQTITEKAICADESVSYMDAVMARLYREVRKTRLRDFKSSQRQWVNQRNRCGSDANCLFDVYIARIKILAKALGDEYGTSGVYSYSSPTEKTDNGDKWSNNGTLWLARFSNGDLTGVIQTVSGPTFHVCYLEMNKLKLIDEGWRWTDTDAEAKLEGKSCKVEIVPDAGGVHVDGTPACHYYCGARGFFSSFYKKQ